MARGWHAISWCTVGFLSQFRDSGKGDRRPPPATKRPCSASRGAKGFSLVDDFGSALGGQRKVGSALDCGALAIASGVWLRFKIVLVAIKGLMWHFYSHKLLFMCGDNLGEVPKVVGRPQGGHFSDHWADPDARPSDQKSPAGLLRGSRCHCALELDRSGRVRDGSLAHRQAGCKFRIASQSAVTSTTAPRILLASNKLQKPNRIGRFSKVVSISRRRINRVRDASASAQLQRSPGPGRQPRNRTRPCAPRRPSSTSCRSGPVPDSCRQRQPTTSRSRPRTRQRWKVQL
jgi:hypothetical protein